MGLQVPYDTARPQFSKASPQDRTQDSRRGLTRCAWREQINLQRNTSLTIIVTGGWSKKKEESEKRIHLPPVF